MRRRLAILVSAIMATVLCAFVIPLAVWIRLLAADKAVDLANTEVAEISAVVLATAGSSSKQAQVDDAVRTLIGTSSNKQLTITVFMPDGTTVGRPAPRTPAVLLAASPEQDSFSVSVPGGRDVLQSVHTQQGPAVAQIFVSNAVMNHGVPQAWLVLSAFGLFLLLLGIAVADQLLTTVTRPINDLARVSLRLASGEMEARAVPYGPSEIREVAAGINHLAEQIRDLIWQERESIADLQHRLRTPLTALRLEAEAAADPEGRLTAQVLALEHAVTALIADARKRSSGPGNCDAAQVVSERAAFWLVLAEDQGRIMRTDLAPSPLPVAAAASDLAACLDALLANVFAHTPEGTRFGIRLRARPDGGAMVSVTDTGPGFGAGDPVKRGSSGADSSGLGLDIARQTAEASGGTLTVGNTETGGGQVIIELGPPLPSSGRTPPPGEETPARSWRR
jgi:signal transduction histidine kinase